MTGRVGFFSRKAEKAGREAAALQHVRERRSVLLMIPVAMLLIIGLGAMLSASSVVAIRATDGVDNLFFFKRQLMWVGLGLSAFVITVRVPYRMWARWAFPMFVLSTIGLVATLLVGDARGGATRWIEVGPLTIQMSEFAKFATVALLAAALTKKEQWLRHFPHFAYPVAAILGTIAALLLLQPDFGTLLIIIAAAFTVMVASAAPLRFIAGLGFLGAALMTAMAVAAPYRMRRLTSFVDPLADPLGAGHQAVQSLVALGTGGWLGVGLGASRARWSFLPNAHTDFIFAIIGEETGFAGSLLVVLVFAAFAAVGVRIALKAPDRFGRLLAVGIVGWLTFQALVNIGGVVAVLPITGVPLPFVSSGGNAMLVALGAVGVLVNIARTPAPAAAARGSDVRS